MDMGEFFYSSREPSYVVMSEDGRAHYGRRPRVVELLVPMCCTKCEEKVRENMLELDGVQGVMVDPTTLRVTVTGFVDPMKTLKKARKVKRDAQLLSGAESHLLPDIVSSKRHRIRSDSYRYRSPISSNFVHHQLPASSTYHTSFNRHRSYGHHVARPSYDEMVITNPCYVSRTAHDGYWH